MRAEYGCAAGALRHFGLASLWTRLRAAAQPHLLGAEYAYAFVSARRVLASGRLRVVGEALFQQLSWRNLRSNFDFRRALAGDLNCQPVGRRGEGRVYPDRGVPDIPIHFRRADHCGDIFEVAGFLVL